VRFFIRGVYTEPYEILRFAQNDRKSEVLLQNDINEGLAMTEMCGRVFRPVRNRPSNSALPHHV